MKVFTFCFLFMSIVVEWIHLNRLCWGITVIYWISGPSACFLSPSTRSVAQVSQGLQIAGHNSVVVLLSGVMFAGSSVQAFCVAGHYSQRNILWHLPAEITRSLGEHQVIACGLHCQRRPLHPRCFRRILAVKRLLLREEASTRCAFVSRRYYNFHLNGHWRERRSYSENVSAFSMNVTLKRCERRKSLWYSGSD